MGVYTTEALILGIKNWGEADKLVTLFSPEKGKIEAIAFGCRRPKNSMAGTLQMFNQIEVTYKEGERLHTLRQCSLKRSCPIMSQDPIAMAYGSFVAEIAAGLAVEGFPQPDMYDRLLRIFLAFERRNPRVVALIAGYQLLEFSGMQLAYQYCVCCGNEITGAGGFSIPRGGSICSSCQEKYREREYTEGVREFLVSILAFDWQEEASLLIKGKFLLAAEELLLTYLRYIFEAPLKSLAIIRQLI